MILILNLADMTFPFMSILVSIFVQNPTVLRIIGACGPPIYRFSLYWSTLMAYFVYLVVKAEKIFNPRKFIVAGLVGCLTAAGLFSLMYSIVRFEC